MLRFAGTTVLNKEVMNKTTQTWGWGTSLQQHIIKLLQYKAKAESGWDQLIYNLIDHDKLGVQLWNPSYISRLHC